jgi:hypothetical protein
MIKNYIASFADLQEVVSGGLATETPWQKPIGHSGRGFSIQDRRVRTP